MWRIVLALLIGLTVSANAEEIGTNSGSAGGSFSGTFTAGDVVVGGPSATQVQDSSALATLPGWVNLPAGLISTPSLFGWGNGAAGLWSSANGDNSGVARVMGGFLTPTGQATYFSRDMDALGASIGISGTPATNTIATASSFTTTSVTLSAPVSCSLLHARVGNNPGTLISTNDTPKFSGEVTGYTCSGGTTSVLTVSAWYQVVGAKIATATVTASAGTSGCINGETVTVGHAAGPDGGLYDWQGTLTTTVAGGVVTGLTVAYAGSYSQGIEPQNPVTLVSASCTGALTATLTWTNVAGVTSAGQTPGGSLVSINPNTKIWGANFAAGFNGTTNRAASGLELDIYNQSGIDEAAGSLPSGPLLSGFSVVNPSANKVGTLQTVIGPSNYGLVIGNNDTTGVLAAIYFNASAAPILGTSATNIQVAKPLNILSSSGVSTLEGNGAIMLQRTGATGAVAGCIVAGVACTWGTTTSATTIQGSTMFFPNILTGGGNEILCFTSSTGAVTWENSVAGCVPSAMNLKNPLGKIEPRDALTKIASLDPAVYSYKNQAEFPGEHDGLYADQVCAIDERLCIRNKAGEVHNYDKTGMLAYVVAAMQAQQAEIEHLKNRWCIGRWCW